MVYERIPLHDDSELDKILSSDSGYSKISMKAIELAWENKEKIKELEKRIDACPCCVDPKMKKPKD